MVLSRRRVKFLIVRLAARGRRNPKMRATRSRMRKPSEKPIGPNSLTRMMIEN